MSSCSYSPSPEELRILAERAAFVPDDAFYKVKNITKTFSETDGKVLKDVCFEVEKGELLSIIGLSGCGKSTLLHIMAAWIEQDSGDVIFKGKRLLRPSEKLMKGNPKIKLVEQHAELLPHHSVYENITFKLRSFVQEYQDFRVDELLRLTNLVGFEKRKPFDLSGGQLQRLAIACALADNPDVILFDEPFSHLDNINRINLLHDLKRILKEEGTTAVFVTHSGEEAMFLSDRILVMKKGEIVEEGKPQDLYFKPKSQYSAGFFGYNNFVSSPEIAKKIGLTLSEDECLCIKATHVRFAENGVLKGEIINSYFQGDTFLYHLEIEEEEWMMVSDEIKNIGEKVEINLKSKPVIVKKEKSI